MFQHYGTALKWSAVGAPKPFGCILDGFTYKGSEQEFLVPNEAADHAALKLHGYVGDISFNGDVDDTSVDLPDLSIGAKIEIDSPDTAVGTVLCSELIEEWAIGTTKKFNGRAMHLPKCVGGTGAAAGALDGFTPEQTLSPVVRPADKIVWSTAGLTSALGTIQRLRIAQSLTISTEADGVGDITAATAHAYIRRITLEVLALASASRPATDTILTIAGAPAHAGGAVIKDSEIKWQRGRRALIAIEALWFDGMTPVTP